jgi:hypothetical protein
MSFIIKQPSLLSRVSNASDCPPDNVEHIASDYPAFYDALYFPEDHFSIFETESFFCEWLLERVSHHSCTCHSCPQVPPCLRKVDWNNQVFYENGCFTINFYGICTTISINDVQSSFFSFCRLHRRFFPVSCEGRPVCGNVGQCQWVSDAECVRNDVPYWMMRNETDYLDCLSRLSIADLKDGSRSLCRFNPRTKFDFIQILVQDFLEERRRFQVPSISFPTVLCRLKVSVAGYFERRYSKTVCCALRDVRIASHFDGEFTLDDLKEYISHVWCIESLKEMDTKLSRVSKQDILRCLLYIPYGFRPTYSTRSIQSCRKALLLHIQKRILYLVSLSPREFFRVFFSVLPSDVGCNQDRNVLIERVLVGEYGEVIVSAFRSQLLSKKEQQRMDRREERTSAVHIAVDDARRISSDWPSVVSDDIVFDCIRNYHRATVWEPPLVCCVCGLQRRREHVVEITISKNGRSSLDFSVLHVADSFLENVTDFEYGFEAINGAVLEPAGFNTSDNLARKGKIGLQICNDCLSALKQNRVSRLSLANYLYRGKLPDDFCDLTWVEEMVCAKYRNTAHVTRIFGSTDPSHPKVFHGNTCAHEMNVISTVSVLPRTPADINDSLSVVFIGSGKFDIACLGNMFRIRKTKVWNFLLWLRSNNRLYRDVPLDAVIMDSYPVDGILPGVENRVFEDCHTDVDQSFEEETSGFAEHPASSLKEISESNSSFVLLERMGVSDPEGAKLTGRAFTASALKNLASRDLPDLVLHRSSQAVPEYNNPDLMPGMFPTLFPLGLGGFEHSLRSPKLSFQSHANALLDVPDKSFRRHQTFLFVALNIMQRRLSHLHTYFTVRKSNFDTIAKRLTTLTPDILLRLANHLEREGSFTNLNDVERDALSLLNHVNTISARIPGSQAAKMFTRNEIRSYFGEFGLPQLYFTFNPSVLHSPIFQVMVGDHAVDLTTQFPFIVPSKERALRLAEDPVAAADFFEFCVSSLFESLFGWNFGTKKSKDDGGILGHLLAFYGTCEFTERGSLHGHFLIWLLGGLNPNDIHLKLKSNPGFQQQFFSYFEDIIQHHLPDVDVAIDVHYEPRVERPPFPPEFSTTTCSSDVLREWRSFMDTEVKKLGEVLQRHRCRPVCHKYGNVENCRFLFPHEFEPFSYFDDDTNSVVLKCLDSMVNYFNRYILVFCRHNHDLKCILSGKAAKAAMCYITDYITKMDLKTYQMLTLLSRAVASIPQESEHSVKKKGRTLLHKCLAQFTRQQQIHAQQAARYLRGKDDTISSHDTTPMMSGLLLDFVSARYTVSEHDYSCLDEEDDVEIEERHLKIQTDVHGNLVSHNQLTDYWFRDASLRNMNFYNFARCISLQLKPKHRRNSSDDDSNNDRLGIQIKHNINVGHPLADTHYLVQHSDDGSENLTTNNGGKQLIPRVVGSNVPRKDTGRRWMLFTLAHFKPFHESSSLIDDGLTLEETYDAYQFSQQSLSTMKNWEETHDCEDERDAERLRKRALLTAESIAMRTSVNRTTNNVDVVIDGVDVTFPCENPHGSRKDFLVLQALRVLEESRWLNPSNLVPDQSAAVVSIDNFSSDVPSPLSPLPSTQLKIWMKSVRHQEEVMVNKRQTGKACIYGPNANNISATDIVPVTEHNINVNTGPSPSLFASRPVCSPTIPVSVNVISSKNSTSPNEICFIIGKEHHLNSQQWIAFRIICHSFIARHVLKYDALSLNEPLRLFMTGPGGTGKTHVVKAVQKVMEYYGVAHTIRFLAPTGSAASLIDGMTVHKGLNIKISSKDKGKGNRLLGDHHEDYSVLISIQNKIKLRNEWRLVEIVMIDECSLLSAELLSQIDAALRFAKENPDEWFGGITVIFAGDLYQYPPVCATALYYAIPRFGSTSQGQIEKRLGRLAWKSVNAVVAFNQQVRMESDVEYATAVTHLRTRECTLLDVDLFNTRVIKSANCETGIDMSVNDGFDATAIVPTNLLRQTMNFRKAATNCSRDNIRLMNCAANDVSSTTTLTDRLLLQLLHLDMSSSKLKDALPGFLPLYIGMPVILKCKNISTDLGITNGSQGFVRNFDIKQGLSGRFYSTCVLVEFPNSKVFLPDLPEKWFPIVPVKSTFTTQLLSESGTKFTTKITRSQLPIQPAFAITGHSAEGKTLSNVLCNLQEGGFGAYVAASRARSRQGLYITEHVKISDLNKSLPYSLIQESRRLSAIEHNTYLRYGVQEGDYQQIPDPESEANIRNPTVNVDFTISRTRRKASKKPEDHVDDFNPTENKTIDNLSMKRASPPLSPSTDDLHVKKRKHRRLTSFSPVREHPPSAGCKWSSSDWSCAYDCVFMTTFYAYLCFNDTSKLSWRRQSTLSSLLSSLFQDLTTAHSIMSCTAFDNARDKMRDFLSDLSPNHFPRYGPIGASAEEIFDHLKDHENTQLFTSYRCSSSSPCEATAMLSRSDSLPSIFFTPLWSTWSQRTTINNNAPPEKATTQQWIDLYFQSKQNSDCHLVHSTNCTASSASCQVYIDNSSPLISFEVVPDTRPVHVPSIDLHIQSRQRRIQYSLRGIIYCGQYHFTARLFDSHHNIWIYDGQANGGFPSSECMLADFSDLTQLTFLHGRNAHLYLYTQTS